MSNRQRHPADQGNLLVHDALSGQEVVNPGLELPYVAPSLPIDYDPTKVDPHPGLSSDLLEGWTVVHKVIKDIARERSNKAFLKWPVGTRPIRNFAESIGAPAPEARELVEGAENKKYSRAQLRLNGYREKQVRRSLEYNVLHQIVDSEVIVGLLPMAVGAVEHRYFGATDQAGIKRQAKRRQTIARFVSKHS